MTRSRFLRLKWLDLGFGLLYAAAGGAVDALVETIGTGKIDPKQLTIAAVSTGVLYIKYKLFSNSKGQFAKKEPKNPML